MANRIALSASELSSLTVDGYFLRSRFLRYSLCYSIIQRGAQRHPRSAMVGGAASTARVDTAVRTDRIAWVTADEEPEVHNRFSRLGKAMEQQLRIVLARFDVQFAVYEGVQKDMEGNVAPFSGYTKHFDALPSQATPRRLTAVVYLNQCKGGQLRLHLKDKHLDVAPEQGLLCVFRSELLEHEVLPVETDRYALTAWYY